MEATAQATKEDKLRVLCNTYYKRCEQDIMGVQGGST